MPSILFSFVYADLRAILLIVQSGCRDQKGPTRSAIAVVSPGHAHNGNRKELNPERLALVLPPLWPR